MLVVGVSFCRGVFWLSCFVWMFVLFGSGCCCFWCFCGCLGLLVLDVWFGGWWLVVLCCFVSCCLLGLVFAGCLAVGLFGCSVLVVGLVVVGLADYLLV